MNLGFNIDHSLPTYRRNKAEVHVENRRIHRHTSGPIETNQSRPQGFLSWYLPNIPQDRNSDHHDVRPYGENAFTLRPGTGSLYEETEIHLVC